MLPIKITINLSEEAIGGRSLGHCKLFFILQRDEMVTNKMLWGKEKRKKTDIGEGLKSIVLTVGIKNSISYFTSVR